MMVQYRTLKTHIEIKGKGIHSGKLSKIKISPTKLKDGINFIIDETYIKSSIKNVFDTYYSTTLYNNSNKIQTVEHLLSALYGLMITNVDIRVLYGNEIPILDGSSYEFVNKILSTGLKPIKKNIKFLKIERVLKIKIGNSLYKIMPSNKFEIICNMETKKSSILNNQTTKFVFNTSNYIKEISKAKTFCYIGDLKNLINSGKAHGGSLDNAIILCNKEILNPEIMTYKDEFTRHKILDFLGDISLLNVYFLAKFELINPNHYANIQLCNYLIKEGGIL